MTTDTTHQKLLDQLQQLEDELRSQSLWSAVAPSPEAMASTMPFMYDTLKLQEWLQWVFLPRLRAVVDARGQLPCQSHVHPLDEHGRRILARERAEGLRFVRPPRRARAPRAAPGDRTAH